MISTKPVKVLLKLDHMRLPEGAQVVSPDTNNECWFIYVDSVQRLMRLLEFYGEDATVYSGPDNKHLVLEVMD
jgi:hypothetical protein